MCDKRYPKEPTNPCPELFNDCTAVVIMDRTVLLMFSSNQRVVSSFPVLVTEIITISRAQDILVQRIQGCHRSRLGESNFLSMTVPTE